MTQDPRLTLEAIVAHLRLAIRECGLPLDVPGGRAYTQDLRAMVERGDLAMMRAARGANRPDVLYATTQGIDRLAGLLERYGEDFGPVSILGRIENVRGR
jgi:hypothetical protein